MAGHFNKDLLVTESSGAPLATLILAHGAGAGMESHPLGFFAKALAERNIRVVRFEFPYMRLRRAEGRRKAPDSSEVLLRSWREVIAEVRESAAPSSLFIGGKSMGGRMASMVADESDVQGVICLGYPFHPPGKPRQLRVAHLTNLRTPALILQGERDPFGTPSEVAAYPLSSSTRVVWIPDGDHSFKPRKQFGRTEEANLDAAVSEMVGFIFGLSR